MGLGDKDYMMDSGNLRTLVDQYNGIQRQRLAAGNRASAIEKGKDEGDAPMYRRIESQMKSLEEDIASNFKEEVTDHPVGDWLLAVRGVGPTMAAKVIGHIGDVRRFATASKLWRYAGYGTVPKCADCDAWIEELEDEEGGSYFASECHKCGSTNFKNVAERPRRGHKLHYDPAFKTTLHTLAEGLLRANSPYREVYDEAYDYYLKNRPSWGHCHDCDTSITDCEKPDEHGEKTYRSRVGKGWATKRIHLASRRKMIKMFLSHVYEAWRRIEELPIRQLYVHEVLGHTDRETPGRFVDYDLPKANWISGNGK